jgi:hypothetical protein
LPRWSAVPARDEHEFDAAVASAAGGGFVGVDRLVGACAAGVDPRCVGAVLDQIALDPRGAPTRGKDLYLISSVES